MYSPVKLVSKYIHYFLTSSNGKGHGVHSPFVFDFIIHVLNDKRAFYAHTQIEYLRNKLLQDSRTIEVEDMGAGSAQGTTRRRLISDLTKYAAKPKKYGQLLFRIAHYLQPAHILELGTSLGISTSYLASADTRIPVITLEGAPLVAMEALKNFDTLGLQNIRLIQGNFDNTLPRILAATGTPNLVFVDGNHRKAATLHYFEQLVQRAGTDTVFIFDDIHWSGEMEEAWEQIKKHEAVTLTIDLFFLGLVFFRTEIKEPQHFRIRY